MNRYIYRVFLAFLHIGVGLKRIMAFIGTWFLHTGHLFFHFHQKTIGFRIEKGLYSVRKLLGIEKKQPIHKNIRDLIGRRSVLQLILFMIVCILATPHTSLYSAERTSIPGRKTILYAVVGPGEFDTEPDEIRVDTSLQRPTDTRTWTQGSAAPQATKTQEGAGADMNQDLSAISLGGSAVTKPTILSETISGSTASTNGVRRSIEEYRVENGDTLGQIAERFGLSVETILWANNLTVRSYIRPGDVLTILPVNGVMHSVVRGDTVSKIASIYGSTSSDIIEINKLQENGADIVIGEKLIVPGGKKSAPVVVPTAPKIRTVFQEVAAPPPSISVPAGSGYIWPTEVRVVTQYSNWRHVALDISGGSARGKSVYAIQSGTVSKSQCGWNGGYGCYIIVDHADGVQSLYAHQDQLFASVGDTVAQGQVIGLLGNTGNSSGPHLHFEIRVNGKQVNPLLYVR